MRNLKSFLILATAAASLSLAAPAFADTITLTLSNPLQSIAPGQTISFNGTLTVAAGNSGDIYVNSDPINILDADSSFSSDDSAFFAMPYPLAAGYTYTGLLFTITDNGSLNEIYSGSFILRGGADGNADNVLADVTFGSPAVTVTPEPSSLILLGTGLTSLVSFGVRRRRRTTQAA